MMGVIPKDWKCTTVGQLVSAGVIEKPLDGNHGNIHPKSSDFVSYGIPFVMANNIKGGHIDFGSCAFIRKKQADSLQKGFSITGDVLLTHKATIGHTALVEEIPFEYIMLTPQVTYYRVADPTRLSNRYLRHFFDSAAFQNVLLLMSGGGTRSYIGITAQLKLPVIIPSLPEQRAIAAALSDVDALIAALNRLIAKKRDIKQAAMQELLTGKRRLPSFSGEWQVVDAGNIGRFRGGSGFSTSYQGEMSGDYPFFKVSDMNNEGNETFMETANNYISEAVRKRLGANIFPPNTIVFAKVGAAVFLERKKILTKHSCIDNNMAGYVLSDDRVDHRYIYYLLLNFRLGNLVSTTALPSLNGSVLNAIKILLPPTKAEQTAIAAILCDMDAEITALEARREKTRAIKQGMMQELLTGRIRLA